MFDLNLQNEKLIENLPEGSGTYTELSGTSSSSSVVNSTAEEFDFFPESTKSFVTQQFFPISDDVGIRVASSDVRNREVFVVGSSSQMSTNQQWLNLSVSDSSAGAGLVTGLGPEQNGKQQVRKSRRGPRSRSSQYRGVTFYRRTGRWESHIWDCGKQVYLGGFDTAHAAARAYDRAAIKFRGVDADINFNIVDYDEDMKQMKDLSKEEFVQVLRRQTNGFARGSSRYRGVTLHKCGQWDARMGQFLGKKAYDKAGEIPFQGNIEGNSHNLDLNLGISIPVAMDGHKESNSMGVHQESHTHHSSFQLANGKRPIMPMNGSSNYPGGGGGKFLYGQPLVARQSNTDLWSGLLPQGLSATYEGKNTDPERMEVNNPTSSYTRYTQDPSREGGGTNRTTMNQIENRLMLSSSTTAAASSGFSYSTTTTPLSQQFNTINIMNSTTRNQEIQISNSRQPQTPSSNTAQYSFLYNHRRI